jgi:hypothetical protein
MQHVAIGFIRWTNEGEGQLCNIPSCPKINFILYSVALGRQGAWVDSVVGEMTCPRLCWRQHWTRWDQHADNCDSAADIIIFVNEVRKSAVDREDSLSTAIPSPLYLPFSVDPRCEDRSFFPDILQLQVQCTDGECFLCPLRVSIGVLRMITPSHRQCSPMYGLAMGVFPSRRSGRWGVLPMCRKGPWGTLPMFIPARWECSLP